MEPMNRQVPNMRQALGRKGVRPQMGGPAGGQGGFPSMPGQGPGPGLGRPQSPPNPNPGGGYSNHLYIPPSIGGNQNIGAQPKPGMDPDGPPQQVPTMPPGAQPPGPPQPGGGAGGPRGQAWEGGQPGNPNAGAFQQWKQRHEQMKGYQPPGQGSQQQQPGVRPDGSYPGPIVDGKQTYIKDGQVVGYDDFAGGQGQGGAKGPWPSQGGWQQAGGPFMEDYSPQQYPQGTYY